MFMFLVRRVLLLSAVVVGVLFAAFALVYYGTNYKLWVTGCDYGDMDIECDAEIYARASETVGVNRPFVVQFADYVCGGLCVPDARRDGLIRGDITGVVTGRGAGYYTNGWLFPIDRSDIIRASLPVSAQLGLAALVILYAVGVPLGTLAAAKRGAWIDRWIAVGCTAVRSAPVVVLGPILIGVALRLEIMDPPGWGYRYRSWGADQPLWEGLFSVSSILPVVVVVLVAMPWVVRMTRAGVIDVLSQDYVRTARAKGMPERMVVSRHVIRSALTTLVSGLVPTLAALLSGLLLVEVLFGIPGFANVFIKSLVHADWLMLLAGVLLGTAAWAVCSLASDLLHRALDPRLRYNGPVARGRSGSRALAV